MFSFVSMVGAISLCLPHPLCVIFSMAFLLVFASGDIRSDRTVKTTEDTNSRKQQKTQICCVAPLHFIQRIWHLGVPEIDNLGKFAILRAVMYQNSYCFLSRISLACIPHPCITYLLVSFRGAGRQTVLPFKRARLAVSPCFQVS